MEGDTRQRVALADVKHRNCVPSIQQLLHQVSAQETGSPDDSTAFTTLYESVFNTFKAKNTELASQRVQTSVHQLTGRTRVAIIS